MIGYFPPVGETNRKGHTMHSDKVAEAFAVDPITLLDDLVQLLHDAGHADLANYQHDLLCLLDSRRVRAA